MEVNVGRRPTPAALRQKDRIVIVLNNPQKRAVLAAYSKMGFSTASEMIRRGIKKMFEENGLDWPE